MAGEGTVDPRKRAEFDRLMSLAHINRMRGEYKQADELVRQALDIVPGDLDARELAADLLYARGDWSQAAEAYKSIYQEDGSRTKAEEKYAKVLLQIAEGQRQQDLLQNLLEHPESAWRLPERSPAIAALLSGIPGFGHVYCGQAIKGVVIMLVTMLSWLLFFVLIPHRLPNEPLGTFITRFTHDMDPFAVIFLTLALAVHAYAVVNAAVTADKLNSRNKGIL